MKMRLLLGAVAASLVVSPAFALDTDTHESLVDKTLDAVEGDETDVAELLKLQDELIQIGVPGVRKYGETNPAHADAIAFVAANVDSMKAARSRPSASAPKRSTLEEIVEHFEDLQD